MMDLMAASTDVAFEDLTSEECLEHLEEVPVGRVALSVHALPVILPVNFVLDDGDVVFMTSSGNEVGRRHRRYRRRFRGR